MRIETYETFVISGEDELDNINFAVKETECTPRIVREWTEAEVKAEIFASNFIHIEREWWEDDRFPQLPEANSLGEAVRIAFDAAWQRFEFCYIHQQSSLLQVKDYFLTSNVKLGAICDDPVMLIAVASALGRRKLKSLVMASARTNENLVYIQNWPITIIRRHQGSGMLWKISERGYVCTETQARAIAEADADLDERLRKERAG